MAADEPASSEPGGSSETTPSSEGARSAEGAAGQASNEQVAAPQPDQGPDENDGKDKKSTGDPGQREREQPESAHQDETGAWDVPGNAEFRKRDRIIREQRRIGEQALSGSSRGIVNAEGAVAMGDDGIAIGTAYFGVLDRQRVPIKGSLSRKWLDERHARFVETDAYRRLVERLTQCRVLVLQGPDGSGRTTTALLALDRVVHPLGQAVDEECPETNVEMLDSEPDAITADDLHKGHGYLLDRSSADFEGQLNLAFLGQLKKLANERNTFLVLIIGDRMSLDLDNLGDYLVLQDRPDPTEVLEAHLRCLKGGADVPWTGQLHDEVNRELAAAPAPGRVAEFALYLADGASRKRSADELLAGFGERLTERARAKLANPFGSDSNGEPHSRAEVLCRRAQLITCSVLDGMPLVTVMDAAMSLAARLYCAQTGQTEERPLPRPVFRGTVDDLLKYAEAADHSGSEAPEGEDVTRRLRMRPVLASCVFQITWQDYDTVRKPLLDWLDELVMHRDYALRVRAAIAVGRLASYDFDYIFDNVIDRWAGCPDCREYYPVHWRAAAWALEMAAHDPSLADGVRDRVGRWCRGLSYDRQRTALFTFATTVGVRHVEDTLDGLCLLAAQDRHACNYVLAHALREVFLAGFHEEVRQELDAWSRADRKSQERPLAVQAARSLLELSEGTGDLNGDPTSVLVSLFADDPKWRDTAMRAWRLALEEPATSEAGWNVLRLWLRRGVREPQLQDSLVGLIAELAQDPGLRSRLRFRQLFWNRNKATRHRVIDDILDRGLSGTRDDPSSQ